MNSSSPPFLNEAAGYSSVSAYDAVSREVGLSVASSSSSLTAARQRLRIQLSSNGAPSLDQVMVAGDVKCHVCGEYGHKTGFVGAIYIDCKNMACYLCKKRDGHTTMTCPFRSRQSALSGVSTTSSSSAPSSTILGPASTPQCLRRMMNSGGAWIDERSVNFLRMRSLSCLPLQTLLLLRERYGSGEISRAALQQAILSAASAPMRVSAAGALLHANTLSSPISLPPATTTAAAALSSDDVISHRSPYYSPLTTTDARSFPWKCTAASIKMHTKRVTCLAFHPSRDCAGILVSADKFGEVGLWRFLNQGNSSRGSSNGDEAMPPPLPFGTESVLESYRRGSKHVFKAHTWVINAMSWGFPGEGRGILYTASGDGCIKQHDLEIGKTVATLVDLKAAAAAAKASSSVFGEDGGSAHHYFYSLASSNTTAAADKNILIAGDDAGMLWFLDKRMPKAVHSMQAHSRNAKVSCLAQNPHDSNLIASSGGDWAARLWDLRWIVGGALAASASASTQRASYATSRASSDTATSAASTHFRPSSACLAEFPHPRAITHLAFSGRGNRLATTCSNNRIYIWNDIKRIAARGASQSYQRAAAAAVAEAAPLLTSGNVDRGGGGRRSLSSSSSFLPLSIPPDNVIVHSHDLSRYIAPFGAVFDPKDATERILVCGRYISEAFDCSLQDGYTSSSGGGGSGGGGGGSSSTRAAAENGGVKKEINHLVALHPIDVLDAGSYESVYPPPPETYTSVAEGGDGREEATGGIVNLDTESWQEEQLYDALAVSEVADNATHVVSQMIHPYLTTISPLVAVHPHLSLIASASSTGLYLWAPRSCFPGEDTATTYKSYSVDDILHYDNADLMRGFAASARSYQQLPIKKRGAAAADFDQDIWAGREEEDDSSDEGDEDGDGRGGGAAPAGSKKKDINEWDSLDLVGSGGSPARKAAMSGKKRGR